ncbi:hypothetical protein HYS54_04995, partial [Candidatus Micrarchaeota archaeon]|nr:hypothetical protein [Candidatus Micrarchaeota archaeon]
YNLSVNSVALTALFEYLIQNYVSLVSKSASKHVAAFLRGFADAEGYVGDHYISISQKGTKLLAFIQMLLLRLGIASKIRETSGGVYQVQIMTSNALKFRDLVGLTASDKMEKLGRMNYVPKPKTIPLERKRVKEFLREIVKHPSKLLRSRSYRHISSDELDKLVSKLKERGIKTPKSDFLQHLLEGNIAWQRVNDIRKLRNREPLYDISVPRNRNFIANGFLVHNSTYRMYLRRSKEDKRIARLVDSPCMPEGECVFRVTERGVEDVDEKEKKRGDKEKD